VIRHDRPRTVAVRTTTVRTPFDVALFASTVVPFAVAGVQPVVGKTPYFSIQAIIAYLALIHVATAFSSYGTATFAPCYGGVRFD
jgi:hypothetical protein